MSEAGWEDHSFDDDPVEEEIVLQEQYPLEHFGSVIEATAAQVRAEVEAQIAAAEQKAQLGRVESAARRADEVLSAQYSGKDGQASWKDMADAVAERVKVDAAAGRVPYDSEAALEDYFRRTYLAERELAKPSKKEADEAYWQSVLALAEKERNPWTS